MQIIWEQLRRWRWILSVQILVNAEKKFCQQNKLEKGHISNFLLCGNFHFSLITIFLENQWKTSVYSTFRQLQTHSPIESSSLHSFYLVLSLFLLFIRNILEIKGKLRIHFHDSEIYQWQFFWQSKSKQEFSKNLLIVFINYQDDELAMAPIMYHERQIRELCALHCLNNLFQGTA